MVDDDAKLCALLSKFLISRGYAPQCRHNGAEGIAQIKKSNPDIVLLDVMMPGESGFEVLKKIRGFSQIPVIMLTARGETTDRIVGLELGADDYMAKPFEPAEIDARIRAVLRRTSASNPNSQENLFVFSNFQLDRVRQRVTRDQEELQLTGAEYRLLEYLCQNQNMVISRGQICEALYGDDYDPFRRNIDILISRLRKKMGPHGESANMLKTIHGRGYMLATEIWGKK